MLITPIQMQPFCILIIPFDIVVNALLGSGYNPERSSRKYMFYKYAHFGAQGVPRHDFSAFDIKLHDQNRAQRTIKKTKKQNEKPQKATQGFGRGGSIPRRVGISGNPFTGVSAVL